MVKRILYLTVTIPSALFLLYACAPPVLFLVGFSPGGGFDIYARTIARHMGKHISGNPTVTVENMTGAGSLIAANYMYTRASPDGLTIGSWYGNLVILQVIGWETVKFDASKFEWIGSPIRDTPVCVLTNKSGITSIEQWMASKTLVKLGGTAPGSDTDDIPKILRTALGLPIQLVSGYKGTADIRLAADAGEVAGGCWAWESIRVTWRREIESGEVIPVLQATPKKHPELPHVPNAIDHAKTDEARQLIKVGVHDRAAIMRAYSLPPGTPRERVQILRKAFMDTLRDPEFLGEARKTRLDIDPVAGEEVERIVNALVKLEPALVGNLKEILK